MDRNAVAPVSIDFNHNPASCTLDATQTAVVDGTIAWVMGWCDKEWGFSSRRGRADSLLRYNQ
jgi:glyceraldehyde 3-phosphate dehydrogenase